MGTQEHKAFLLLLAIVTVAFFWLLIPFYGAVLWAVILAIVFQPLQRRLERRFHRGSNTAASLSVLVCIVIAVIPMTIIVTSLVTEGADLVTRAQAGEFDVPSFLKGLQDSLPGWSQRWIDQTGMGDLDTLRERLVGALASAGQFLAGQALNVGQNTLRFVGSVGIMLYVLFFLFRDGAAIGRYIREAMPLSEDLNRRLLAMFAAVVRATVKGNIIIAIIQGAIGGITFWLLGIEGALLWGVLMTFLSMLPAVGSALVWAPTAGILLLSGSVARGIILIAVGAGVIGLIDNVLRPILVGKGTRLPDYVILVSTLGGLSIFGINGFVLGPIIAALFLAGWAVFRAERLERDPSRQ
jgi:predicted PurR-regulated permease PerM